MPRPLKQQVQKAMNPSQWDLSNQILYDMCEQFPNHQDQREILAKILLIGRVYSAAIERRRVIENVGDDFYACTVAPCIRKSNIDKWIGQSRAVRLGSDEALDGMIRAHREVTNLFSKISGLNKRSLASKYLHFHVPELFFIYDSRSAKGIASVSKLFGIKVKRRGIGDATYEKFAEECHLLRLAILERYGITMSPRQLDNFLLNHE
jgi:hypothetical protein